jgi:predicted negative regulator of RcsB-dependent stress response
VDDYLSEKEQWEAVKAWLRDNGLWIVAGIAVGALGIATWNWYQGHTDNVATQASIKYEQLVDAFGHGNHSQGLVLLGELERDYPSSPYLDQAKLEAAKSYVESSDLDKAAKELQTVVGHSKDSELVLIARMRLARVQVARQQPDAALNTLNVEAGAFAPRFHEVKGDAYYAKGDKTNALKEYLSAKASDFTGASNGDSLDLKIADLSANAAVPSAVPPPTAAVSK